MTDRIPTASRVGWATIEAEHDFTEAEVVLGHPLLVGLLCRWQSLCQDGEPPRRDHDGIDALILKPDVFPQISMVEGVERNGLRDLRYRMIGTALAHDIGSDAIGRYARDILADPAYANELIAAAYLTIDRRQPVAAIGRFVSADPASAPVVDYRLDLPLKKLASGTPLLLVCQLCVQDGRIVPRPVREGTVYEPTTIVAFVDLSLARESEK